MRQITREVVSAFLSLTPFAKSNSAVRVEGEYAFLGLHGNTIAEIDEGGDLYITNAGWQSNTTKERLNGLPGVSIYQKKGVWYLNAVEWDGSWKYIGKIGELK